MGFQITVGYIPEDSTVEVVVAGLGEQSPFAEEVILVDNHDEISSPAAGTSLVLEALWRYDAPDLNADVWKEITNLFLYDVVDESNWAPPEAFARCWACFCGLEEGRGASVIAGAGEKGTFTNPGGKWNGHFYVWMQAEVSNEDRLDPKLMVVKAGEAPDSWKSRFDT